MKIDFWSTYYFIIRTKIADCDSPNPIALLLKCLLSISKLELPNGLRAEVDPRYGKRKQL